ncbi:MAG: hypothetical protein WA303_07505 [Bradyrhizobium sp.]|jgi:hypothetical protein
MGVSRYRSLLTHPRGMDFRSNEADRIALKLPTALPFEPFPERSAALFVVTMPAHGQVEPRYGLRHACRNRRLDDRRQPEKLALTPGRS